MWPSGVIWCACAGTRTGRTRPYYRILSDKTILFNREELAPLTARNPGDPSGPIVGIDYNTGKSSNGASAGVRRTTVFPATNSYLASTTMLERRRELRFWSPYRRRGAYSKRQLAAYDHPGPTVGSSLTFKGDNDGEQPTLSLATSAAETTTGKPWCRITTAFPPGYSRAMHVQPGVKYRGPMWASMVRYP